MEANKKIILMALYSPQETGAPDFIFRAREYKAESDALMAYAEISCYWSRLVSRAKFESKTEDEWIKQMEYEARTTVEWIKQREHEARGY